jgi:hypothetical protein
MVLPGEQQAHLSRAAELAADGHRVLVLAHASGPPHGESLPPGLRAAAFVLLTERLRPDAAETLAYFTAQGVALKVISGDSPRTVGTVAAHGFARLFPLPAVRGFYALELPRGEVWITLLVAALGAVAVAAFWLISSRGHRRARSADAVR